MSRLSRLGTAGLSTWAFTRLFGSGPMAGIAARGVTYLGDELKEALTKGDQHVTRVRLQPGERYTVVAYPKATRRERRLARRQSALLADYQSLTRASRRQQKAARRLKRAQRRLDRTKPGSRRHEERQAFEAKRGMEFDRAMRPTKRLVRTATELDSVSRELNGIRGRSFEAASRGSRRTKRVTVYG